MLAWSTGAQVAVAAGVKALDIAADHAAAAARSEDAARERAATAEIIAAARHARWLTLQESAVPLIAELAAGTADPGDAQVRIRCAVQAARLRRLMAEGDEVPGSLVHELHAVPMWPSGGGSPSRSRRPGRYRRCPARPGGL